MKPTHRNENLIVQSVDNELMIYDLNDNRAFCLNQTSSFVWQACNGNNSTLEIANLLGSHLGQPATEDLVWLTIDQLKKEQLLENTNELVSPFAGLSRREVIKKVGLGTMIALPLVASLVAPSSTHAASLLAPGATYGVVVGNCSPTTQTTNCTNTATTTCQSGTSITQSCNGGANLVCVCCANGSPFPCTGP